MTGDLTNPVSAAFTYADRGWRVFPTRAGSKSPATPHGFRDAVKDAHSVAALFEGQTNAGVAIATGRMSGLVVVDVDVKNDAGGLASLNSLEAELGLSLRDTYVVSTPSSGLHLYFAIAQDGVAPTGNSVTVGDLLAPSVVLGSRVGVRPGIDVRADGGYVVAPPTALADGTYIVVRDRAPAPLPDTLLAVLRSAASSVNGTGQGFLASHDVLSGVPEGQRDEMLFRACCGWRRQHARDADGGRGAVTALALEAARNCTPPFPESEARAKIEQAFRQDHSHSAPRRALTDDGNALRYVDQHGDEIRFNRDSRSYYVWNETLWVPGNSELAVAKARATARAISREAEEIEDDELAKKVLAWAKSSQSRGKIEAMPALARSDERISAAFEDFDRDPFLLNVINGTIDLRTGDLHPHRRDDLISRKANASYDPAATAPIWDSFLRRCTHESPELVAFLQRLAGYAATGSVAEEVAAIFYGPGGTGKSKFTGALQHVLGSYSVEADSELLVKGRNDRHSDALFHIIGARLVVATEASARAKLDERFFKQLTGGDMINARQLYAQSKDYQPTWQIVWSTNHLPDVERFDEAIRRRMLVVPFTAVIPPEERDRSLAQRLVAEADGILRWIVEGAIKWHADLEATRLDTSVPTTGLTLPSEVISATNEYEIEVDPLTDFIADQCWLESSLATPRSDLYKAYRLWCAMQDERQPLSNQQFFGRMRDRRDVTERSDRAFAGIGLKDQP